MQYTIGTALGRALDAGHDVEVLIEGQWLGGRVVANDGVGLVLENSETEHSVVRIENINAVRVFAATPHRHRLRAAPQPTEERLQDGSMPMPGPRVPAE
ncbi:hypothetical protein EFL95_15680 [Nocardioides marmorisolisilvae]|uniref:Uncharacterized protein n=2 Tax=Nocardioides marmorisolisilvae TaxID=1542737 RepID=A0A3N0DPA0_9ACTN|nr:hypothetical protein EFL95_15680 [Nocardioides marmorisolisilvae]